MDNNTALVVAIIAGCVALASAGIALYGQWLMRRSERTTRREDEARALLTRYREPLLRSAFDLQSRLYNICAEHKDFLGSYLAHGTAEDRRYAESSTMWTVGQFLGWVEILRREVQFLDLGSLERNRRLEEHLTAIRRTLQTDDDPCLELRLFAADQRAIGEVMIVKRLGRDDVARSDCMGYAEFTESLETERFARWFSSLRLDLQSMSADRSCRARAARLQRALIDLIEHLAHEEDHRFSPGELTRLADPSRATEAPG